MCSTHLQTLQSQTRRMVSLRHMQHNQALDPVSVAIYLCTKRSGLVRELNPGPLAPEARIIPLDQRAIVAAKIQYYISTSVAFFMQDQYIQQIRQCNEMHMYVKQPVLHCCCFYLKMFGGALCWAIHQCWISLAL